LLHTLSKHKQKGKERKGKHNMAINCEWLDTPISEGLYWSYDPEKGVLHGRNRQQSSSIRITSIIGNKDPREVVNALNEASKKFNNPKLEDFNFSKPGSRIAMVKELRGCRDLGLKEAKELVESLLQEDQGGLPFTPYSGIPELEGMGYFPFEPTQPFPLEGAEVLGYNICDKPQEVSEVIAWSVDLYLDTFLIRPCFMLLESGLGWNPVDKVLVMVGARPGTSFLECETHEEAVQGIEILRKAFKAGEESMKQKVVKAMT